ncbi:MAG: hydrogenase nickel incorporation protein HypB [Cyanobacteria bacterium SBLK]|nr:hydrogenase nickel incorporation protein HypB [Cyanobacteria bacterium SBLK]
MCVTCGCSDGAQTTITRLSSTESNAVDTDRSHAHSDRGHHHHDRHTHSHRQPDGTVITHSHSHHEPDGTVITHSHAPKVRDRKIGQTLLLEQNLLSKNDRIARHNRQLLQEKNIKALNLVSSPGSGKTTLLVRTIQDLQSQIPIAVIEGDQETLHDAERIAATGCPAIQVNTGTGCHLEADMIQRGLDNLSPPDNSLLLIENVGNLVCPALFDLGEQAKVAMLSVTEGEDKPLKYPHMFRASRVMVLTKVDLLPHVPFDVERCLDYARSVNPDLVIFQVSAVTGQGLDDWYRWLVA